MSITSPIEVPELVAPVRPAVVDLLLEWSGMSAHGSAFALESRDDVRLGLLVTVAHLLEGDPRVTATLADGSRRPAAILAKSPERDLAVLELSERTARLPWRAVAAVRVGEPVLAIGCPYGLGGTVTAGIVSAVQRPRTLPPGARIPDAIQFDALIGPGASGGPLVGWDGRVLGVCQAQQQDGRGGRSQHAFAVPAETAVRLIASVD
jgi:S1-C subfamily serine protease